VGTEVNGVLTQGFLYGVEQGPVAELNGVGNLVSRFVYGTNPMIPDYMVQNGVTYRLITDGLGSVRLVVNAATGQVAQQMTYDAFGRVTQDTNPGFQPFGYAGGLYDSRTGLVRLGARDYDASTGRWTAKDPLLFAGGDTNLYSYVGNSPLNFVDQAGTTSGFTSLDGPGGFVAVGFGGGMDSGKGTLYNVPQSILRTQTVTHIVKHKRIVCKKVGSTIQNRDLKYVSKNRYNSGFGVGGQLVGHSWGATNADTFDQF
jgi:RHS repeat-associated protein